MGPLSAPSPQAPFNPETKRIAQNLYAALESAQNHVQGSPPCTNRQLNKSFFKEVVAKGELLPLSLTMKRILRKFFANPLLEEYATQEKDQLKARVILDKQNAEVIKLLEDYKQYIIEQVRTLCPKAKYIVIILNKKWKIYIREWDAKKNRFNLYDITNQEKSEKVKPYFLAREKSKDLAESYINYIFFPSHFFASLLPQPASHPEPPHLLPTKHHIAKDLSGKDLPPKQAAWALELFARFDSDKTLKTHESIVEYILKSPTDSNKYFLFKLKNYSENLPYRTQDFTQTLNMRLKHIITHLYKSQISYLCLIANSKCFHYVRINKDTFQITRNQQNEVLFTHSLTIPKKKERALSHLVFFSHRERFTLSIQEVEKNFYYNFRPFSLQSITLKKAPFHHEVQCANLCCLHALNAYIGCRYYTPSQLLNNQGKWLKNAWLNKSNENSSENSSDRSSDKSKESSSDKASDKPDGFDPRFIASLLDKITVHKIEYVDLNSTPPYFQNVAKDLKRIDRFILGVSAGDRQHALTFRKDDNGIWWRIDSERNEQDSFDEEELLKMLETEEADSLHFIFPEGDFNPESIKAQI